MIEVIVAAFLVAGAAMSIVGSLDASRNLTSSSERVEAATHVAQQELERILALGYEEIAMEAPGPQHVDDLDHPRYHVQDADDEGDPPTYRWNHAAGAGEPHTEPLVLRDPGADPAPAVGSEPSAWDDGRLSGEVHRFVTWVDDASCPSDPDDLCPGGNDYKRVTVAVTIDGEERPRKPILIAALARDPSDAANGGVSDGVQNPLEDPRTQCLDENGELVECAGSVGSDSAHTWFLYDTPATASGYRQIAGDHPTHPTVAAAGTCDTDDQSGCQVPDLMGADPPPAPTPLPPLYDYSSEIAGASYAGGRAVYRDVGCDVEPSADNAKGQLWVTEPLAAEKALTGAGALTFHSQTLSGASAGATLCLAFYDVAGAVPDLAQSTPAELGRVSYSATSWPASMGAASFSFDFRQGDAGSVAVAAGRRIGLRVWPAASSGADLALAYDHPSYASSVQLNAEGGS